MGTSHYEPCMRAGEEYRLMRGAVSLYGDAWNFLTKREGITRFWEDGLYGWIAHRVLEKIFSAYLN